jgi:hypothetical protein
MKNDQSVEEMGKVIENETTMREQSDGVGRGTKGSWDRDILQDASMNKEQKIINFVYRIEKNPQSIKV